MKFYLTIIGLLLGSCIIANNVQVSNPQLINNDGENQTYVVNFDISWENSWRTSSAPNNWDAVWVFAKYRVGDNGEWKHAKLDNLAANHSINTNNGIQGTIEPSSDSLGVLMYRANDGSGNIDWDGVNLLWNYSSDATVGSDYVEVKVFALEMVYIPEGAFELGDGIGTGAAFQAFGRFCQADDITTTYTISSELGFNLGGTDAANLSVNDDKDGTYFTRTKEDFIDGGNVVALSDNFPKGYGAFYLMKYELSQSGYVEFLNTLTRVQQDERVETDILQTSITNIYVMTNTANVLTNSTDNAICCETSYPDITSPITFYCNYDEDGVYNETDDGGDLGANMIDNYDYSAYLDWAGLRPMSEFEYEKACRGTQTPVVGEYAYGAASWTTIDAVNNYTSPNSTSATVGANVNVKTFPANAIFKVLRSGIYATASSTREEANGSYYGVIDLSGNLAEYIVNIGFSEGRAFNGIYGDGALQTSGNHDVLGWPSYEGFGLRGGQFTEYFVFSQVSDRYWAIRSTQYRHRSFGIRGVR